MLSAGSHLTSLLLLFREVKRRLKEEGIQLIGEAPGGVKTGWK